MLVSNSLGDTTASIDISSNSTETTLITQLQLPANYGQLPLKIIKFDKNIPLID